MDNEQKIAVITGGNRGLGFEISRQLAKREIKVILTSRDPNKGQAAANKLKEEGLDIIFHVLDVTDSESIKSLTEFIENRFGHLEILVNNAGLFIDPKEESSLKANIETIRKTMETNTYGSLQLCQALIPLMKIRNYGRIVNISSSLGQLTNMNGGYIGYRLSKTALNGVTRIFADELRDSNILINSACPGWVKTDMGGPGAQISPEEGTDTIIWLATLPDGSPSGGFYRERKAIEW